MDEPMKHEYLKRLNYIDGHLKGIRKMVEDDKYCVDVLRQTFAVRKAIQKLERLMLEGHLPRLRSRRHARRSGGAGCRRAG